MRRWTPVPHATLRQWRRSPTRSAQCTPHGERITGSLESSRRCSCRQTARTGCPCRSRRTGTEMSFPERLVAWSTPRAPLRSGTTSRAEVGMLRRASISPDSRWRGHCRSRRFSKREWRLASMCATHPGRICFAGSKARRTATGAQCAFRWRGWLLGRREGPAAASAHPKIGIRRGAMRLRAGERRLARAKHHAFRRGLP